MADNEQTNENAGQFLLKEKDFVKVVDAEGNDLPPVPKHWGADQLPAGAEKKGRASSSGRSGQSGSQSGADAEPAGNASREDWATYAEKVKGAKPEDLLDADGKDLGRDELREKFGTPSGS
ncbi:hypothetical protein [Nocardioides lijunqiniae]|uniref:hypothetical protein n=1 Tax=Nocardioides lijunqiniae TaxID=2760832 RepID=UPI00187750F0|nr:hypothetical protein [Nocardioides lijunqiniae]